jgi:hypothetical protein
MKEKVRRSVHADQNFRGKVHLAKSEVHKSQNYYTLAIRRNVNHLEAMKRAVWAVFFTSCHFLRNTKRGLCPGCNK